MFSLGSVQLIAQNYIKYNRLVELTNFAFAGSDANECDILIDLNSVLLPLYNTYDMSLDKSEWEIASTIINMIAHYRSFYWSNYKVRTRFYFIYSDNLGQYNKMYFPSYNEKFAVKTTSKQFIYNHIKKNLNIVSLIASYINDVFYFESNFDVSTMMAYVMNEKLKSQQFIPNIIITKDMVLGQLVGLESMFQQNVTIFRPKKLNGEDLSYPITIGNLYESLFYHYKVQFNKDKKLEAPELYSFLLACSKCPERDMKSILSITSVYNTLYELTTHNIIYSGYNTDIMNIIQCFDEKSKMSLLKSNVISRFKAIDAVYQYSILNNNPDRLAFKGFMNLYDPSGLHDIADKYFKECPLNLERM